MNAAERMRRTRKRRQVGRRILQIECDEDAIDWLLDWLGVIPPIDDIVEREQTALTIGRLIDSLPSLVARNATRR